MGDKSVRKKQFIIDKAREQISSENERVTVP